MKLSQLSSSDLLQWYLFLDSQLEKITPLNSDVSENEKFHEEIELQIQMDDMAIKMVHIANLLHFRLKDIDFNIDYQGLSDIQAEDH